MFQRRHMIAIAEEIMSWDNATLTKEYIVNNLCSFFSFHNPNFDSHRFKKACESFEGELSG